MLAGVLLLAVVWVFLLRYVPDRRSMPDGPDSLPDRADLLCAPSLRGRPGGAGVPAGVRLLGGWILAGRMLAP